MKNTNSQVEFITLFNAKTNLYLLPDYLQIFLLIRLRDDGVIPK